MPTDGRTIPLSRPAVKLNNDSRVYNVIRNYNVPVTVADVHKELTDVTEKTIRRAIKSLSATGFVIEAGKRDGAFLYQASSSKPNWDDENGKRIPMGNSFVSVNDFIEAMVNPKVNPFSANLKQEVFTEGISQYLRTRMLLVVMTSGEAGFANQVEIVRNSLLKVQGEVERLLAILQKFTESAVWYEQYRDGIAYDIRRVQETNPELYELAWAFVKSGSSERESK
jgi:hypothetical protein